MQSIFSLMAILLVGGAAATSLGRVYLPPQLTVQRAQNVYGGSLGESRYSAPAVQLQQTQYVSQPQLTLERPQNVYVAPVSVRRPNIRIASIPDRSYSAPIVQLQQQQYVSRPQVIVQRPQVIVQRPQVFAQRKQVILQRPQLRSLDAYSPSVGIQSQYGLARTYLPPQGIGRF